MATLRLDVHWDVQDHSALDKVLAWHMGLLAKSDPVRHLSKDAVSLYFGKADDAAQVIKAAAEIVSTYEDATGGQHSRVALVSNGSLADCLNLEHAENFRKSFTPGQACYSEVDLFPAAGIASATYSTGAPPRGASQGDIYRKAAELMSGGPLDAIRQLTGVSATLISGNPGEFSLDWAIAAGLRGGTSHVGGAADRQYSMGALGVIAPVSLWAITYVAAVSRGYDTPEKLTGLGERMRTSHQVSSGDRVFVMRPVSQKEGGMMLEALACYGILERGAGAYAVPRQYRR